MLERCRPGCACSSPPNCINRNLRLPHQPTHSCFLASWPARSPPMRQRLDHFWSAGHFLEYLGYYTLDPFPKRAVHELCTMRIPRDVDQHSELMSITIPK